MQNGVQVIDILVEMSVQIRHVLPPNSFRFEDKNPLRKTAAIFKAGLNLLFAQCRRTHRALCPSLLARCFAG
jgi:hypothetical protein